MSFGIPQVVCQANSIGTVIQEGSTSSRSESIQRQVSFQTTVQLTSTSQSIQTTWWSSCIESDLQDCSRWRFFSRYVHVGDLAQCHLWTSIMSRRWIFHGYVIISSIIVCDLMLFKRNCRWNLYCYWSPCKNRGQQVTDPEYKQQEAKTTCKCIWLCGLAIQGVEEQKVDRGNHVWVCSRSLLHNSLVCWSSCIFVSCWCLTFDISYSCT